jgi:CRISPR-associated protein (TIGR03984 family)
MKLPDEVDTSTVSEDLPGWLKNNSTGCDYLLAHTLQGVIWGRLISGTLTTSHDALRNYSPQLQPETLQQCFIFGAHTEVLLWQNDGGWCARTMTDEVLDESLEASWALDEEQMLWGTRSEQQNNGFTLVCDGMEGLRHAVPQEVPDTAFQSNQQRLGGRLRPLRLLVRHYIREDSYGVAYISHSRLVDLLPPKKGNER